MKFLVRILALALVLIMALSMLVACGGRLSGTYESESGDMYLFEGNEFTCASGTTQLKGTYEIMKDGDETRIVLRYDERVVDGKVTKLEEPRYIGSEKGLILRQGEDYISMSEGNGIFTRYNKK
ncbi:MAG: hypothetical protein E7609_04760 [Ruminococcaceae bacterium]|nr:hypothetical protein [Oscillospiraceae bacterium]